MQTRKIWVNTIIFIAIIILLFALLLHGENPQEVWNSICSAQPGFVVMGMVLAFTFNLAEGMNLRILLRTFGCTVSFSQSMKYAFTGFFFSSITPSSTGGQPMQLYMMKKDGISLSHGTLALLVELLSFQFSAFLLECGAAVRMIFMPVSMSPLMQTLAVVGFALNSAFIIVLVLVILSEKAGNKILYLTEKVICILPVMKQSTKEKLAGNLKDGFREYHSCAILMKEKKSVTAKVVGISIIQVLAWFSIPFVIYMALGGQAGQYWNLLLLQILLYMISALLPLPGAVGINELAFLNLFLMVYKRTQIKAAVLLTRGISFYFLLFVNGALLLLIILSEKRKSAR